MNNIIVAFPKQETAQNLKKILLQNGFHVDAVCSTGSQALQSANELGGGIVICGYRFVDMMYTELHEYLPDQFEMLLVASPANCGERDLEMIAEAKALLMERNNMTEEEAHRYIQKRSMDNGTGLTETAQMILSLLLA